MADGTIITDISVVTPCTIPASSPCVSSTGDGKTGLCVCVPTSRSSRPRLSSRSCAPRSSVGVGCALECQASQLGSISISSCISTATVSECKPIDSICDAIPCVGVDRRGVEPSMGVSSLPSAAVAEKPSVSVAAGSEADVACTTVSPSSASCATSSATLGPRGNDQAEVADTSPCRLRERRRRTRSGLADNESETISFAVARDVKEFCVSAEVME